MLYKPVKSSLSNNYIEIKTETNHIIKFKITPKVSVDLDNEENGKPFFYVTFDNEYIEVLNDKKSISLDSIRKQYKFKNLLTPELVYDHIQIGFIYANEDPNNHRWMLNFMDVNNKHLFNYIGDNIKVNCPFTTISWEDGIWHGRFVVYKKDVLELTEPTSGQFILSGLGNIGDHIVNPIKDDVDNVSLRYNIHTNMWYCDLIKDKKIIGEIPCKNIISDVNFEGSVDKSSSKPKVSAILKIEDIKGISMALNALIIKRK